MSRRSLPTKLAIALLTLIVVAGGFTSFQRKRSSFERLDFHWIWKDGVILVDRVDPGSGADAAGLRVGDQIWVVGGVPSNELDGLKKTLRESGPVPLVIGRNGETLATRYTPPPLKIEYHYLFFTLIGFLYLAIGLFTLFRGGRGESSLFYLVTLLTFVVGVYSPAGEYDTAYEVLFGIEELARIFLPPLTLHFFLRFPRPLFAKGRYLAAIYAVPAIVALWSANLYVFGNAVPIASTETSIRILDRWEMLHFAVYFTLAFIALTYTFRTAPAAGQRKQIKWIYLGVAVGFIPFLVLYLIPFISSGRGSAYTTVAILPLAFIPLAFAVSILRYKLWDVEVVIKEVLAYTVTFVFGMIAFSTVNVLLSHLLEERLALERNFLAFASGLLIAGVLVPVKGRIENVLRDAALPGHLPPSPRDDRLRAGALDVSRPARADRLDPRAARSGGPPRADEPLHSRRRGPRPLPFAGAGPERDPGERPRPDSAEPPAAPRCAAPSRKLRGSAPAPRAPATVTPFRCGIAASFRACCSAGTSGARSRSRATTSSSSARSRRPLALAIENARLYGRLRRQLEQIQLLKEFNENIIESSSSAIVVVTADGTS